MTNERMQNEWVVPLYYTVRACLVAPPVMCFVYWIGDAVLNIY